MPLGFNAWKDYAFAERLWPQIEKTSTCWNWRGAAQSKRPWLNFPGYGVIRINKKLYRVHRLMFELTFGEIPENTFVCHKCDNSLCVNPFHLWLGTLQENQKDMADKSRSNKGEKNPRSKLTKQQVLEIRSQPNRPYGELAKEYGVRTDEISRIISRKRWGWL